MPGKKGGNKGIARSKKAQKRLEAEERNAKTPIERTRAYRRRMEAEQGFFPIPDYQLKGYDA